MKCIALIKVIDLSTTHFFSFSFILIGWGWVYATVILFIWVEVFSLRNSEKTSPSLHIAQTAEAEKEWGMTNQSYQNYKSSGIEKRFFLNASTSSFHHHQNVYSIFKHSTASSSSIKLFQQLAPMVVHQPTNFWIPPVVNKSSHQTTNSLSEQAANLEAHP